MAPLAVDPEALYAAGSAVAAAGGGLAANLTVLAAGFSAHTGVDRAGEVFGVGYQDAAKSLLKAAAAAGNACLKCGALIQQGASNYSKAEVASTLGGAGGVLEAPSPPTDVAAPGPPGTMGPGEPPPLLWSIVESLVLESWPDGDVAGLRAAASRWRDFAAAAKGVKRTLNASKTLLDTQHLPESDKIDTALNEIGSAAATLGENCDELAKKIDTFANKVGHAQHAIRDLLHRLGSLGDLGHDIMLIIDGDAWDEIKKIAKDINDVLGHLGQEARACEQEIRLLMQAADREIVTCEKYARRGLIQFLGDDVGNPVATAFDTWINVHEGVVKGAVDMGLGLADLSPHWFFVDPQGAAATWTGLGKSAWKGSLFNAPLHPQEFADAKLQELKGLVHAEDWSGARPGLGAGENLFDVATLLLPGAGEAGAAADGAGAAARGAEAEAEAAGAAGRTGGIAGARDALTGISKASAELPKTLEGVTKDLPEIKPPTSGASAALPPGKPIEPPIESAPRPADGAPGTPQGSGPPAAEVPRPVAVDGPPDPATAPPSRPAVDSGPHDPISVPAEVPREPASVPAGGPHEPAGGPHEGPREPASVPGEGPHEPASAPRQPLSEPVGGPHEPGPASEPPEPGPIPKDRPYEPAAMPAAGAPPAPSDAAAGERAPSAIAHSAEFAPGHVTTPHGGPPVRPAPVAPHPSPTAPSAKSASHSLPPGGRPVGIPAPGRNPHFPGDGGPPNGGPKPPLNKSSKLGDGDPPADQHPVANGDYPSTPPGHLDSDDLGALADYTGPGYLDLNNALRGGEMDASQQVRIEAVKTALAKLPPYEGPVIRGTNLPPEVLARYRPGEVITEDAFLSTTTNAGVARSPTFAGNVEFRILSKSGRDISPFSLFPGEREVLFPPGTKFYVSSKRIDPLTGRTIIRMIER
ncbi:ADP-ribosyltransferase [Mycobacterium sp. 852002-51971_SCH5477799-a]|uniref:ADP-ribosyltransferase n=1 Tax=Mycobacterium sp. 852002-51971_SCH5477799-a TaxID=1834106 RepID=UPI000AD2102D|nr:ADP-ribosyltransferase [Mycobacterium sp. 852002-51971_SCH5477799-a]